MSTPPLHLRCVGQGPDLVLLHGWGMHAGIWAPIVDLLATEFRLHLIDLPGHGLSAPVGPFALETICALLSDAVPAHAHWLGWSLGGMLALDFAARYPQRVERLILLATNPCFVATDSWPYGMKHDVLEGFAQDLLRDHKATLNRFLGLIARGASDKTVLRELRRALSEAPPPAESALQGGLAILRDADLRPRLNALPMPVLMLGGARDTLVPVAALHAVHDQCSHVQLQVIADAGHAPFISHPQKTVAAISGFLL